VVMNAGKIHQVGTPYHIFHKPQNVFVAGFVGSPTMNFVDGRLSREADGRLMFEAQDLKQPVPERYLQYTTETNVEAVKWGIRPENIRLANGSNANDVVARINVVEPLGSRDLLNVQIGNCPFTVITEAEVESLRKVGSNCFLCFPEEFVHLFDSKTGEAMN